jgi:tetrapyrrole methylase family protein/MazG family protein/ATP diphosphatase
VSDVQRLLDIMARLRDPEGGCPWDVEQTFESIAPYTIEEAYEVDDAIRRGDPAALRDELGDLLLQVVFHARMAEEAKQFSFGDVVDSVCEKLVRRHPHVFADATIETAHAQTEAWERQKSVERAQRGETSLADGIPLGLPALMRARKLLGRAERSAASPTSRERVEDRVDASLVALHAALPERDPTTLDALLGDLLLSVPALGRSFELDPEAALRGAVARLESQLREAESPAGETGA